MQTPQTTENNNVTQTTSKSSSSQSTTKNKSDFELLIEKTDQQTVTTYNKLTPTNGVVIGSIVSLIDGQIRVNLSIHKDSHNTLQKTLHDTINENAIIAHSMVEITATDVGSQCAIMFQQGLIDKPIIMGLLIEPVFTSSDLANQSQNSQPENSQQENAMIEELDEDNTETAIPESLHIVAEQQIILQCGDSVLYMDADGHMEMRANRMITHSRGLNRIKGASVKIN